MAHAEKKLYAIILFLPREPSDNTIDLIPSSWIVDAESDVPQCQYPASKDYAKLTQWVEQLKRPEKKWKYFKIEILSYARNVKQGMRRLNRAFQTIDVQSTDRSASQEERILPTILNESVFNEELNNVPQLNASWTGEENRSVNEIDTELINEDDVEEAATKRRNTNNFPEDKFDAILSAINAAKRSILYDIDKKINSLKNTIVTNRLAQEPSGDIVQIKESLETTLPMENLQDFLRFEQLIGESEQKKKGLIYFYRLLICGETSINGIGKRDFSRTHTFSCIKDILTEKNGTSTELKTLSTIMSR